MGARVLILGEALVDVVCEKQVASWDEADSFVPHFGGAPANVAVTAARLGSEPFLAGGVGRDAWGGWLERRLTEEGVDLTWFVREPHLKTPVAFVTVDATAEPSYDFHGDRLAPGVAFLGDRLLEAVEATDALFYTSNTMLAADEREVTRAGRLRAAELGRPVIYDPNLRTDRWTDASEAIELAREGVPGALLVKANRTEAGLLTGIEQPLGAAHALVADGASCAVVTLGPDGAAAAFRGGGSIEVPGERATPVCTTGAGDTVTGVLIAALAAADFDARAVEEALPRAVEAAARATERWGAV